MRSSRGGRASRQLAPPFTGGSSSRKGGTDAANGEGRERSTRMTVAALPGNVRLRRFQIGKETTFGTAVPATIRLPGTFAPNDDPHVTFPTADTGTLDDVLPPYRAAGDYGGAYT